MWHDQQCSPFRILAFPPHLYARLSIKAAKMTKMDVLGHKQSSVNSPRELKFRANETFPHETGNKQNSPWMKWITGRRRIDCSNYKAVKNRHAIWTVLKNRQELKPILKHWLHQCLRGTKSFRTFLQLSNNTACGGFLIVFMHCFWISTSLHCTALCFASKLSCHKGQFWIKSE